MNFTRFLMLLALAAWLGALLFFPFVAQISFSAAPVHLAGMIVRNSLITLHWMGMVAGVIFLACSLLEGRVARGSFSPLRASHLLIAVMLALTATSQFKIIPRMDALRAAAGEISSLSALDPIRQQFDSLHAWSTRLEEAVLILGLVVFFLTTKRVGNPR